MWKWIRKLLPWSESSEESEITDVQGVMQSGPLVKLTSQEMPPFNGEPGSWFKWKEKASMALNATGYYQIINSMEFAQANPIMNSVVYSQIALATIDGLSYHLVKEFEGTKDGYGAWYKMNQ